MNILKKMNELVGSEATKEEIVNWAYMNRITVMDVAYEEEFVELKNSVSEFIETYDYHGMADEHEAWDKFLDFEFIIEYRN